MVSRYLFLGPLCCSECVQCYALTRQALESVDIALFRGSGSSGVCNAMQVMHPPYRISRRSKEEGCSIAVWPSVMTYCTVSCFRTTAIVICHCLISGRCQEQAAVCNATCAGRCISVFTLWAFPFMLPAEGMVRVN
jgi:hypothetical protein